MGKLSDRVTRCERAIAATDASDGYCRCLVARKDCIHMTWAPSGELEPEPEICPTCGKPYRVIRLTWGDDDLSDEEVGNDEQDK